MSGEAPKPPTTSDLLATLIDEIRGLRADLRQRSGLPDVRIGKCKTRDWTGPDYEGKAASDCPSDFLLVYAGFLEWGAGKNREEGKDGYAATSEREALMCRRWAAVNKHLVAPAAKPAWSKPADKAPDAPAPATTTAAAPASAPAPKWNSNGSGWRKPAQGDTQS